MHGSVGHDSTEAAAPKHIDLIVPARNEQENVPALLAALPAGLLRHVIVVDNGSTDATAEAARAGGAIVVAEPRRGYGAACLAGLAWIHRRADPPHAVAFMDADLADDPAQLCVLCRLLDERECDLTIGSRVTLADPGALTATQRVGNALACRLIRWFTGVRFTDLGPMRVIRYRSLERLGMADRTWGWTVEMQFKAARQGMKVVELDVPYRPRRAGRSKISGSIVGSVRAGWRILATIARLAAQRPVKQVD